MSAAPRLSWLTTSNTRSKTRGLGQPAQQRLADAQVHRRALGGWDQGVGRLLDAVVQEAMAVRGHDDQTGPHGLGQGFRGFLLARDPLPLPTPTGRRPGPGRPVASSPPPCRATAARACPPSGRPRCRCSPLSRMLATSQRHRRLRSSRSISRSSCRVCRNWMVKKGLPPVFSWMRSHSGAHLGRRGAEGIGHEGQQLRAAERPQHRDPPRGRRPSSSRSPPPTAGAPRRPRCPGRRRSETGVGSRAGSPGPGPAPGWRSRPTADRRGTAPAGGPAGRSTPMKLPKHQAEAVLRLGRRPARAPAAAARSPVPPGGSRRRSAAPLLPRPSCSRRRHSAIRASLPARISCTCSVNACTMVE